MNVEFGSLVRVAARYAARILEGVQREYPNALQHVMTGPEDVPTPRSLHPAFYGCFDWHSAVLMHWALVRLLRLAPRSFDPQPAVAVLEAHLTRDNLTREADYFQIRPGFERPYGWGWALTLAAELDAWSDARAGVWRSAVQPLADTLTELYMRWLSTATYPVRIGLHANSAFGLARALPWAQVLAGQGDGRLSTAIAQTARRWYGQDRDYPAHLEPGGSDFLSPALSEVELMLGILQPTEFRAWLAQFLPGLDRGEPATLFTPALVSDARDGQTAHLHGLNLYRAYVLRRLSGALPPDDPRRAILAAGAERHARAGLDVVTGSDYMVEHWVAGYAVLYLSA